MNTGEEENISFPVRVENLGVPEKLALGLMFSCALMEDHTVKCWGSNEYGQLAVGYTGDQPHSSPEDTVMLPY